jgi:hypothetical protein
LRTSRIQTPVRSLLAALYVVGLLFAVGLPSRGVKSKTLPPDPCGPPPAAHPSPDHFQLVPQQFSPNFPQWDANNLMMNPQWGWQVLHPVTMQDGENKPNRCNFPDSIDPHLCGDPDFKDCSGGQATTSDAPVRDRVNCVMCSFGSAWEKRHLGHVNWFPATYKGTACFHNCSYPDMDYTFSLAPEGFAGLTRWNAPSERKSDNEKVPLAFHVEFDSRETVNLFKSEEWSRFRKMAGPCWSKDSGIPFLNSCDQNGARNFFDRQRAVVIGLMGLDSEHNVYSELHPVYALAIEKEPGKLGTDGVIHDNVWLIFARNSGDEGACSTQMHPLYSPADEAFAGPLTTLKLLIPSPEKWEVLGVRRVEPTQFFSNNSSCPQFDYYHDDRYSEYGDGVMATFDLSPCGGPDCAPMVEGELHLDWRVTAPAARPAPEAARKVKDKCVISPELLREERMDMEDAKPNASQASRLLAKLAEERAEGMKNFIACRFSGTGDILASAGRPAEPAARPSPGRLPMRQGSSSGKHYKKITDILLDPK